MKLRLLAALLTVVVNVSGAAAVYHLFGVFGFVVWVGFCLGSLQAVVNAR